MKKTLMTASAAALLLATASAFAADLPSRKDEPVYVPPPVLTWTGFYVGLNAGGVFGGNNDTSIGTAAGAINTGVLSATGVNHALDYAVASNAYLPGNNFGGFIGGGQVGYNYQWGNFVIGLETDIQGVAGTSTTTTANGLASIAGESPVAAGMQASRSLDYLGTVRGRIGYLVTPTLLIYGTGGFAYGGATSYAGIIAAETVPTGLLPTGAAGSFSDILTGWTAGGGLEWMFMPNWSAKLEYLYYDLGNATYALSPMVGSLAAPPAIAFAHASAVSARYNGNIVRAGVSYHFNWGAPAPVLAKY
jgi:outer membrane immunogenic protein